MTTPRYDNQSFYDRDAATYNATRFVDPSGRREHDQLSTILDAELTAAAPSTVLEIGPGAGRISRILQRHATSLTLLDIAPAMLAQAQAACLEDDPAAQPTLVNGSILDIPLETGSFDLVVSINVLTHIRDYVTAFTELARVTAPDGTVIFSTTRLDSLYLPGALVTRVTGKAVGYDVPSYWPSNRYVTNSLAAAGLELVRSHSMYHAPRRIRSIPGMERMISRADRMARTNSLVGRAAPWVLWVCQKR
jgi:ubiquinone/menaquinone biosynthesis C-methylase UbiE